MQISKKILSIFVIFSISFAGIPVFNVNAQDGIQVTDTQVQIIKDNCVSVKATLNRLHSSDALLRVNRGQVYELISSKLMSRFNSRLSTNNIANESFVFITTDYNAVLNDFRLDYIKYEKQLTKALNIDCINSPVEFYEAVDLARTERGQLRYEVLKLDDFARQYSTTLTQFKSDFLTSQESKK